MVEPSDLQYLTDEDVEEIGRSCLWAARLRLRSDARLVLLCPPGGALTRVEKKRLQAAVQATRGAPLAPVVRLLGLQLSGDM